MRVLTRSLAFPSLVLAVLLTACQTSAPPSIKPTSPLVTDCLVVPQRQVRKPPTPPATLTDEWARAIWAWASDALGTITADRTEWQGERDCIRGKAATGVIR